MYSARKIIAVILAFVMVFAMSASVFAASFPDLEGHWSETFMNDMYERGLMTGYPDGTMGPEKLITGAEALTFLAKLYTVNDTEAAAIHEDFGKTVDAVTSTAWVKPFVERALAAGIITEDELKAMALFEPVEKQQLAQLIVRAVKMTGDAKALEGTELTFADTELIDEECFGSVALLSKLEITVGDNHNNFGPVGNVTRAVAATMVSKIFAYVEGGGIDLRIEGYSGLSYAEGFLSKAGKASLTVRDLNGIFHVYDKAADFGASINGSSKTTSVGTSLEGYPVKLTLVEGKVSLAEITTEKDVKYIQTKFLQAYNTNGGIRTYDYYTDTTVGYDAMQAAFTMNGATFYYVQLEANDFLTIKTVDKALTEVTVTRGTTEFEGEVSSITYGTVVEVTVANEDGIVLLPLNLSRLPEITRSGHASGIDKLATGDTVTVTVKGGEITKLAIDGTTSTVTGVLTRTEQAADGTTWFITGEDGKETPYTLARNVVAYNEKGSTVKTAAFGIGDEVSLIVDNGEITEITMIKAHIAPTASPEKITVKVINVDVKEREIAVITEAGEFFYVNCGYGVSILVTATGKTISLSALSVDDEIILYGSYNEDGEFVATSIVIENKL